MLIELKLADGVENQLIEEAERKNIDVTTLIHSILNERFRKSVLPEDINYRMLDILNEQDIGKDVRRAIEKLFTIDLVLFKNGVHEQTITSMIASYLRQYLLEYDVDCEYNRYGKDIKRGNEIGIDGKNKPIKPDIIVHSRGNKDGNNHLVIEVKTSKSQQSKKKDIKKLINLKDDPNYNYKFALFIEFIKGDKPNVSDIEWVDGNNMANPISR